MNLRSIPKGKLVLDILSTWGLCKNVPALKCTRLSVHIWKYLVPMILLHVLCCCFQIAPNTNSAGMHVWKCKFQSLQPRLNFMSLIQIQTLYLRMEYKIHWNAGNLYPELGCFLKMAQLYRVFFGLTMAGPGIKMPCHLSLKSHDAQRSSTTCTLQQYDTF